jgi:hypothetical protein
MENKMDLDRFCVKFFARPGAELDEAVFTDIFHEWIRHKKLGGTLIDVADYRHVPEGPGIMLITHEINFAMDHADGRLGFLAQRKLGHGRNHQERILELIQAATTFGALLEADPRVAGKLSLEGGMFHFMANDRLLAPNTEASFAILKPDLAAVAAIIYPGYPGVSITRLENDPRDRLTIAVEMGSLDMSVLTETAAVVA